MFGATKRGKLGYGRGRPRPMRPRRVLTDPTQDPGIEAHGLLLAMDNLKAELQEPLSAGDCPEFLRRYYQARRNLNTVRGLSSGAEGLSPIDEHGEPWRADMSRISYLTRALSALLAHADGFADQCEDILLRQRNFGEVA